MIALERPGAGHGPRSPGWRARARVWLLAAALAWVAGPALAQGPVRIVDDRGVALEFGRPPQRIVSLLPSLTEMLCALQACDRLVGVDRWSDWPDAVRGLPRLGGIDDVALEALVRLKPDVVLAARSQRLLERLEALGLKVVALESDRHADVQRSLQVLSALLGRPDEGTRVWARLQAELDAAAARVPPQLRGRSVYVEIGSGGYAAGPASFVGETLTRLGLANAAPSDAGPFPRLNPEFVLRAQPELVIGSARVVRGMPSRPGWQGLAALREGRVCALETPAWNALVRPGPRLGEAAGLIADCLSRLPARP
ncbi:MAG: ABC transporter substrate-binding protein [Rubrivivax sp.]|nr:ABC transporter substrate-binding protein [Rubrivivax sp.]